MPFVACSYLRGNYAFGASVKTVTDSSAIASPMTSSLPSSPSSASSSPNSVVLGDRSTVPGTCPQHTDSDRDSGRIVPAAWLCSGCGLGRDPAQPGAEVAGACAAFYDSDLRRRNGQEGEGHRQPNMVDPRVLRIGICLVGGKGYSSSTRDGLKIRSQLL